MATKILKMSNSNNDSSSCFHLSRDFAKHCAVKLRNIGEFEKIYTCSWVRKNIFSEKSWISFEIISALMVPRPGLNIAD
jgi:hypothetical protein